VRATRTLLARKEPFTVAGQKVEAAVVEDRSLEEGELHEIALDYYAQADDGTVYYLGEDVDYYEDGRVIGMRERSGTAGRPTSWAWPCRPTRGPVPSSSSRTCPERGPSATA